MIEVSYNVHLRNAAEPIVMTGLQVGRFALRATRGGKALGRPLRAYAIDHVPTGRMMCDFTHYDDALAFADDISRFASSDPIGPSVVELTHQLGLLICRWMVACLAADKYAPFRDFTAWP